MKYLAFGVILTLISGACTSHTKKRNRIMQFDCNNHFNISFEERTTITDDDSITKITVSVKSKDFNKELDMQQARAASGVKYSSKDGYIFWEHQGEFTFGTEDSTYCLCD